MKLVTIQASLQFEVPIDYNEQQIAAVIAKISCNATPLIEGDRLTTEINRTIINNTPAGQQRENVVNVGVFVPEGQVPTIKYL